MKASKLIAIVTMLLVWMSCGESISKESPNKKGFETIEKELKNKFGDKAYYTDVTVTYNKSIGNIIGVTVAEAPESLKMGQWNRAQGKWQQNSEITIEVPLGFKPIDFMFQLNDAISLSKLGELVEVSIEKLKAQKSIKNPVLSLASIKFPKNGDVSKTEYLVMLQPENGGTTFTFRYQLKGDLIGMDY